MLTANWCSPEKRRSWSEECRNGLTGPTTTTLPGRKGRTGSSGNVWQNWGYLARIWQAQEDRWRQQQGSRGSERNSLAPQVRHRSELSNGEFRRSNFLQGVNQDRFLGDALIFGRESRLAGSRCRIASHCGPTFRTLGMDRLVCGSAHIIV